MQEFFEPKVSIVIPVYNGSNYLREAIDSALNQTYPNVEVLVINDGSLDEGATERIALSYGEKIRYFKKENGGVATALNLGIEKMTGEYFSWLSHDDAYLPEKIAKQIAFLSKQAEKAVILYSDYHLINQESKITATCKMDHAMLQAKPEYALLRGCINGIALLIPKTAFDCFGLFDASLFCTQDYKLWHTFFQGYRFMHMDVVLVKYRVHSEQATISNPRVVSEGNPLWLHMIESTSSEAQERLEGNSFCFHKEMARFLKNTPYQEATDYCERMCLQIRNELNPQLKEIKVSVIIPFYNRKADVIRALQSALQQSHQNIEVILVNDGSEDNLSDLYDQIQKDARIKLIEYQPNQGASHARNMGIEAATGAYIAFLDSDDLFCDKKIEIQLEEMALTGMEVSHTSYIRRSDDDLIIHSGQYLAGNPLPDIVCNCCITMTTAMLKRSLLADSAYRFDTSLSVGEDVCFWLNLLRDKNILGIDEPLSIVHVNEMSAVKNKNKLILGNKIIITYLLNDPVYQKYDMQISILACAYAEIVQGSTCLGKAAVLERLKCAEQSAAQYQYSAQAAEQLNVQMLASTSWRVTRPIRWTKLILSSVKHNGVGVTIRKIKERIQLKLGI